MNKFTKSLKNVLTLNFMLLTTLPIVLISFFTLELLNHQMSSQIIEKNSIVADSLASETQSFLATADKVIQQAADDVEYLGMFDGELVQHDLALIIKNFPFFDHIQVVDDNGTVVMMVPAKRDYVGNNLAGHSYYKITKNSKQPFWSTAFISSVTGQPTITYVHPLKEGMIVANINLGSLNQVVAHVKPLVDGWAGIMDTDGTYIGHTAVEKVAQRKNMRQFDYTQNALNGEGGNYQGIYNGESYLISVAIVEPIGWSVVVGQKKDTALAPLETARRIFIVGSIIALLFAGIVAIGLLDNILRPIFALVKNIQAVAAGEYQVVVGVESYEELAVLSHDFGLMAEAVASREKALQDSEQELEISLRNLEASNRELDQFAYVASHDLKAPLRAIMNLSQWLEEDLGKCIDEKSKEKLILLRNRALRMENLIKGILAYSRVGKIKDKTELVDTQQLLVEVVGELEYSSGFRIVVDSYMPKVMGNSTQLWQVFSNLINNAFKHHHRLEGVIHISAKEQEDFYEFSVADNGPGIDETQHQKIFQIFQTLKPKDQFESTGVGLALVQKIIQQQGGSVSVKSKLGEGATFIFTWPKLNS